MNVNILFYSNKCKTCELFMTHCKNFDVLKHFKLICIDDATGKIPNSLKVVPSILVKGNSNLIEGKLAFEWLKGLVSMRKSMNQEQNNGQIALTTKDTEDNKKSIMGFASTEMSGLSDDFAFVQIDNPLPKSFLPLGADKEYAIYTAPECGKINKKQQDQLINKFNSERSTDQQEFENKIKEEHNNIKKNIKK